MAYALGPFDGVARPIPALVGGQVGRTMSWSAARPRPAGSARLAGRSPRPGAGVSPTAVRPTRPCSVRQLIMWNTTPVCRAWSKCRPCRATMSKRSSRLEPSQVVATRGGRSRPGASPARSGVRNSAVVGVVAAVGEELQGQERVRRAALAEVELDGVRRPGARRVLHDDEVEREPAQHTLARPAARRSRWRPR